MDTQSTKYIYLQSLNLDLLFSFEANKWAV